MNRIQTAEPIKPLKKTATKSIVVTGMCSAVLAILSQLAIPMPTGIPVTLQTFAVALVGFVLASKLAVSSIGIYILLGAVGVPVFSNLKGGIGALLGPTGGFVWGFLFLALLCGEQIVRKSKKITITAKLILAMIGLVICHTFGILQFSVLQNMSFAESALLVSIPYIVKDIISIVLAYIVGMQLRIRLIRANIL